MATLCTPHVLLRKGAGSSSHVAVGHPVHMTTLCTWPPCAHGHPVHTATLCTPHVLSDFRDTSLLRGEHPRPSCSQSAISWRPLLTPKWPVAPTPSPASTSQHVLPGLQPPLTHQSSSLGLERTQGKGSILTFRGRAPGFLTGAQQSLQDKPVPNMRAIIPGQNWDSDAYLEGNKSHPQLRVPRVLPNLPVKLLHPGLEERTLSVRL